jgi:hypothetical protein
MVVSFWGWAPQSLHAFFGALFFLLGRGFTTLWYLEAECLADINLLADEGGDFLRLACMLYALNRTHHVQDLLNVSAENSTSNLPSCPSYDHARVLRAALWLKNFSCSSRK